MRLADAWRRAGGRGVAVASAAGGASGSAACAESAHHATDDTTSHAEELRHRRLHRVPSIGMRRIIDKKPRPQPNDRRRARIRDTNQRRGESRNADRRRCSRRCSRGMTVAGCTSSSRTSAPELESNLTYDGLAKVKDSKARGAWMRPDFSLAGYTKIMLPGAGIEYRPVKPVNRAAPLERRRSSRSPGTASAPAYESLAMRFKPNSRNRRNFSSSTSPVPTC